MDEAVIQAKLGADIIVAQGGEAGGHGTSESNIFCLVPQVATALREVEKAEKRDILVVAAGGVVDGRGLAAALSLGADGILMGTRFLVSKESPDPDSTKNRLVELREGAGTVRTRTWDILAGGFWPQRYNGRAVANSSSDKYVGREAEFEKEMGKDPKMWAELAQVHLQKKKARDYTEAPLWAGAGVGGITSVLTVQEIVSGTVKEAIEVIQQQSSKIVTSKL